MAVSAKLLTTDGVSSNLNSWPTASITPGANRLIVVFILTDGGTPSSVTGCGLTWVQEVLDTALVPVALWRSMAASPTTGQLTITPGGNNVGSWIVVEYDGVDTSGTNGSGAIVQSAHTTGAGATSASVSLASGITAGNATAAAFIKGGVSAFTAGSGYTILGETGASGFAEHAHEWDASGTQNPDITWTGSANWAGIAIEIRAAGAGAPLTVVEAGPLLRRPAVGPSHPGRFLVPWWDPNPPVASTIVTADATITAAAAPAASGQRIADGAATITGAGTIAAAGVIIQPATATITATGTVAAAGTLIRPADAAVTATGTLTADGQLAGRVDADASITSAGTIAAAGTLTQQAGAGISATSSITGQGQIIRPAAAAVTTTAAITGTASQIQLATAAVTTAAVLVATAAVSGPFTVGLLTAAIDASATLTATAAPTSTLTPSAQAGGPS